MDAREAEGCKRPVGFPQCSETGCCQQNLEDHGETCWNQQTRNLPYLPPHLCHNDPDSQGTDIYTTSKLLGHTSVHTTEIYADVVMEKKADAVNLTNGLFG